MELTRLFGAFLCSVYGEYYLEEKGRGFMWTKSMSALKYIGMYCAVMPKCQRREVEIPCCMFELAYFYASFCMMND